MIPRQHASLKTIFLWCLIATCGIASLCLVFVSFFSLWIGFSNMQQEGFWVPVLAGAILLVVAMFFFIRATKRILFHMKEADVFNA